MLYGDRKFKLHAFTLYWREIEYFIPRDFVLSVESLCSLSFFKYFVVKLCPLKVCSFIIVGL